MCAIISAIDCTGIKVLLMSIKHIDSYEPREHATVYANVVCGVGNIEGEVRLAVYHTTTTQNTPIMPQSCSNQHFQGLLYHY